MKVKNPQNWQPVSPDTEPDAAGQGLDPHDKSLSRTRRKEASKELQKLGRRLAKLPVHVRAGLPLDAAVLEAIEQLNAMSSHTARKRQMLYLGKLLRRIDATGLIGLLDQNDQQALPSTASHQRAEQWRDQLLQNRDQALQTLLRQRANVPESTLDSQQLRALLRQIDQQQQAGKPPAAKRKLYQLLHAEDQQTPLPMLPDYGASG